MFEQLVESEPTGAEFKGRRSYFMVSSVVVGILFLTAVVISIYAADIGLGGEALELVEMLPPVNPAVAPEQPQPRRMTPTAASPQNNLPTRVENMARVDEPLAPDTISTTPNTHLARPDAGKFNIGRFDSDPNVDNGGSGRSAGPTTGTTGGGLTVAQGPESKDADLPPVPVKKDPPAIKKVPSLGVINGKALNLPKPVYSAAAIAVRADGAVNVQVMIDETGKVISASAVSGNPLLRSAAEMAARRATFSPTLLSNVPVKVTGVIVYNFVR